MGPTRTILFSVGTIEGLYVSPSHTRDTDEAIWPDRGEDADKAFICYNDCEEWLLP